MLLILVRDVDAEIALRGLPHQQVEVVEVNPRRITFVAAGLIQSDVELYNGDMINGGRGEILLRASA